MREKASQRYFCFFVDRGVVMVKLEPIGEAGGGGREPSHAKLTGLEFGTLNEGDLVSFFANAILSVHEAFAKKQL